MSPFDRCSYVLRTKRQLRDVSQFSAGASSATEPEGARHGWGGFQPCSIPKLRQAIQAFSSSLKSPARLCACDIIDQAWEVRECG